MHFSLPRIRAGVCSAKHRFEEVTEIGIRAPLIARAAEFEAFIQVRRRPEILAVLPLVAYSS